MVEFPGKPMRMHHNYFVGIPSDEKLPIAVVFAPALPFPTTEATALAMGTALHLTPEACDVDVWVRGKVLALHLRTPCRHRVDRRAPGPLTLASDAVRLTFVAGDDPVFDRLARVGEHVGVREHGGAL